MSVKSLGPAILLLSAALANGPGADAQSRAATISLEDRIRMATQIYHIVSTFFPGLHQEKFDVDYTEYLRVILRSDDRREFDLASMEFVAHLHDRHSWFTADRFCAATMPPTRSTRRLPPAKPSSIHLIRLTPAA
jgi:hypothetical protein